MNLQMSVLERINPRYVGKSYDVLCEGFDEEKDMYVGRAYFQAPDIDGRTYFTAENGAVRGEFVRVKIDRFDVYDLFGHAEQE